MQSPVRLALSAFIPLVFAATDRNLYREPQITCLSEFDYDYKTLKKVVELEHAQGLLKNKITAQQQMLQDVFQKVTSLEKTRSSVVAFTAVLSSTGVSDLGPGAVVIFDEVITNIGQAYDKNTGIFTAPVKGLYVFEMDIMTRKGERRYLQMVKNGKHLMWFYGSALGAEHYVSSSRDVTLELEVGDRMWIRTRESQGYDGAVHGNTFSSFTGWLQKAL